ncbi:MAG: Spy/CpxP family protein refolding chaperone [Planctomyces sp.]|nr:Spy/CpxP family protein refolding chaperone [Planctomyces sp.]
MFTFSILSRIAGSLVFVCSLTCCGASPCVAAQASASQPGISEADDVVSESPPAIPYKALMLAISGFGKNELQLTDEQRGRIREIQSANIQMPMLISRLRIASGLDYSNQGLLEAAVKLIEQKSEDHAAHEILSVLTEVQIREYRTKHRGTIQRQLSERVTQDTPALRPGITTLHQVASLMQKQDLLTLLEGSDALDTLQLTDSQYSEFQELREQAWPRAISAMRDCYAIITEAEQAGRAAQNANPQVNPVNTKLMEQTMAILSEQQQQEYKTSVARLFQDLNEKLSRNPSAMMELIATHQAHGQPVEIRTEVRNGTSAIRVRLHNYFAVPEHAKQLNVTEQQQTQIANVLSQAEEEASTYMQKSHSVTQEGEAATTNRVRERVAEYHKASYDTILTLLSSEQTKTLKSHQLRQLGLEALRLPHIQTELQLSDTQCQELNQILSRPMAVSDSTITISASESQKRLSEIPRTPEEARQRFEEHRKQFEAQNVEREKAFRIYAQQRHRDVWTVLTPEQQNQFKALTGFTDPPPSDKNI